MPGPLVKDHLTVGSVDPRLVSTDSAFNHPVTKCKFFE